MTQEIAVDVSEEEVLCFGPALPYHEEGDDGGRSAEYVISISDKAHFRRPHIAGRCWRRPGAHFRNFELVGDLGKTEYDALCCDCWRAEVVAEGTGVASDVGEGEESSSSWSRSLEAYEP